MTLFYTVLMDKNINVLSFYIIFIKLEKRKPTKVNKNKPFLIVLCTVFILYYISRAVLHVSVSGMIFFLCFLTDFNYFPLKKNSECFRIKSKQVKKKKMTILKDGFSYFFIDFQ